jgi:putative sigma-54 modulation protein
MDVIIQGHDIKVNDALEGFARKKLDKLDRYLPNISEIRIDLGHERTRRGDDFVSAQITIRHERGAILRAEERVPNDVESAISGAVDNMYRRIQRFKGKHSRKGAERFSLTLDEMNIAEDIPDVAVYEAEPSLNGDGGGQPDVIRRKTIPVIAMNEAEAIEQMELLGHTFFMFYNGDSGKINVLYKRSSGGYGLLVPQNE